ncbi:MAG: ribosome maturation factor RimM [Paludibacteraceae bacterium]|nr:ribosome maturation factor RimM [Paludibacteraceae bacterium]
MINREDVVQIGQIQKPHGLQGELAFSFTSDVFDEVDIPYFICEIDGILVPFFIENYRFKNDEIALVKFERIDSEEDAKILINSPLFIEKKFLSDDISDAEIEGDTYYIGFKVLDENDELIGEITDIDNETENVLFLVVNEKGDEYIIPAVDDYIIEINDDQKEMKMQLPEGLLDMSKAEDAGE